MQTRAALRPLCDGEREINRHHQQGRGCEHPKKIAQLPHGGNLTQISAKQRIVSAESGLDKNFVRTQSGIDARAATGSSSTTARTAAKPCRTCTPHGL